MAYKLFIISLLLITVPLLGLAPEVYSQTVTTITSLNTVTTNLTFTEGNLSTVGKVTTTMSEEATLIATSDTLPGLGAQGSQGCNEGHLGPYYANFSQPIVTTLSSNQLINFFIMNSTQYTAWNSVTTCDPRQAKGALYIYEDTQSVVVNWRAPVNGTYYFVFTTSSFSDAVISFNFGAPTHIVTSYLQYVTLSSFRTAEVTQTLTSFVTSQIGQSSQIPTGLIEFVLVIIALMTTVALWKRFRRSSV